MQIIIFLQTECKLCFLSISDEQDDISKPITTVDSSSNGWMTSPHPSLLGATIAMGRRCPSLLSYHCSDEPVAHDHSDLQFVTTVHVHSSDARAGPQLTSCT
jgi:hypothetical protein